MFVVITIPANYVDVNLALRDYFSAMIQYVKSGLSKMSHGSNSVFAHVIRIWYENKMHKIYVFDLSLSLIANGLSKHFSDSHLTSSHINHDFLLLSMA